MLESRNLELTGSPNARDFGGYTTNNGGQVRWGCLFRSGRMSDLTPADKTHFQNLNIRDVIDLRGADEANSSVSTLSEMSNLTIFQLPVEPGNYDEFMRRVDRKSLTYQIMFEQMQGIYRELALGHSASFRQIFELLLDAEGGVLIHCSAGKDRTGFAAALILLLLGVPQETVVEDYMLTKQYYPPAGEVERVRRDFARYFADVDDYQVFKAILEVNEAYLLAGLSAIEEHFGDIDNYLEGELGLSKRHRQQLQKKYVLV